MIVDRSHIQAFFGEPTEQDFFGRVPVDWRERIFSLPLGEEGKAVDCDDTHDIAFPKLKQLVVENQRDSRVFVESSLDLSRCSSLDELFEFFTQITRHSLAWSDYRSEPEFFAPIYRTQRYFQCHGDGSCIGMSLLFQGLAQSILDLDLEVRYCAHPEGIFSHAYTVYGDRFYDPDLKLTGTIESLSSQVPWAWYLNLIENEAAGAPRAVSHTATRLLSVPMLEYVKTIRSWAHREVAVPGGSYDRFLAGYQASVLSESSMLSIEADDYDWKEAYRAAAGAPPFFLGKPKAALCWELPVGAVLTFGDRKYREELSLLTQTYYGRAHARLSIPVSSASTLSVSCPEIPWAVVGEQGYVLNGLEMPGGLSFLSAYGSSMDPSNPIVELKSEVHNEVELVMPLNVWAWNSEYMTVRVASPEQSTEACVITVLC